MSRRFAAAMATVVLLAAGCAQPPPEGASGEDIYLELCARCHSRDLSGGIGPPLGPRSAAADRSDDYYRTTILRGRGAMPAFSGTLSEAQVEVLIEYLRSRQ